MRLHRLAFAAIVTSSYVASAGCAPDAAEEDAVSTDGLQELDAPNASLPPTMGWNTWNKLRCDFDEKVILAQADALVSSGMRDAGYDTLVLDDCWQGPRNADGQLTWDAQKFPRGLVALGNELHARNLKFGIYTAAGKVTCQWKPGSWGHEAADARTFASWGVDFLKDDWCWHAAALEILGTLPVAAPYQTMRAALDSVDRTIVFSVAPMGAPFAVAIEPAKNVGEWAPALGDSWRVAGDITDDWAGVLRGLAKANDWAAAASPGHYNDPDMLEVGNGGLNADEARAHFSMWAMAGAPLIAGNDLLTMDEGARAILTNRRVIAIDQDRRELQGTKVLEAPNGLEVWSKPLSGAGHRAVAFFNPTGKDAAMSIDWPAIGLADAPARFRDVWTDRASENVRGYEATVAPHGVVVLDVLGSEPIAPRGVVFVSDLVFTYAANYWGLVERDASVGDRGPHDGHVLRIGGRTFDKGLGTHAPSDVRVRLGARCSTFEADIGLDDETLFSGVARFEVWADGQRLHASADKGKGPAEHITVDVSGRRELRLVTRGSGDTRYDHTDWGAAKVTCKP